MVRVSTCFWHSSSCVKHGASSSVSVARVIWTYKGGVNSASGENSKEPSSSTTSTEASFNKNSKEETQIYSNITCPNRSYGKYWRSFSLLRNLLNVKTSRTLKIDVFEISDNKHIGKLFSRYKLLFLDQANSISDPSQILIIEFPVPRDFLSPLPSLFNFALADWNPSSTQSSSCSESVSLFFPNPFDHMPPQVLNIPKHMTSQANEIYYQAISRS